MRPLGFSLEDKYVKRAGLDYWDKLEIEEHDSFEKFFRKICARGTSYVFCYDKGKTGVFGWFI